MHLKKVGSLFIKRFHEEVHFLRKFMSTANNIEPKFLQYSKYGEPQAVLQLVDGCHEQPGVNQVTVKWHYAPVNPADINTLQGKYPSKPVLPAIGGNEGVGEIIEIGPKSNIGFCVGDLVIPKKLNIGTWKTRGIYNSEDLLKIRKEMDLIPASMLTVNPCTAYRMLKDFVCLQPGDTVIQNGGNSAAGQFVIQLCKIWGFNSVNIIRDRENVKDLKSHLKKLGATVVLTEKELRTTDIFKSQKLPVPQLALNCVCGQNASEVQRHLGHGGVMVTYGAMSREPLIASASSLIFKDITYKGFWMSRWTNTHLDAKERQEMLDELQCLFIEKKLVVPPYSLVLLCEYKTAINNTLNPSSKNNNKQILDLSES